jgi:hypothetical protein
MSYIILRSTWLIVLNIHSPTEDNSSPLLFKFALKYAISNVQENQVVLKLNGTHKLLAYADIVSLLGDIIKN